jgi:hypothetical protein
LLLGHGQLGLDLESQQSSTYSTPYQQSIDIAARIDDAHGIIAVNVLGVDGLEAPYISAIFGMKQKTLRTKMQLQLTQVLGFADGLNHVHWITSTEPISGQGLEVIVSTSSAAPLLVVVPVQELSTVQWKARLRKLLETQFSKRLVVFLAIYCNETIDQHEVVNKLGILTRDMFWLSATAAPSQISSCCMEIQSILVKSVPLLYPWLQAEKMVLLERSQESKLMPSSRLLDHPSSISHLADVSQHLQRKGLILSPFHGNTMAIPDVILQPNVLSYKVDSLMEMCKVCSSEVPSAQHGLIPKSKLKAMATANQLKQLVPNLHTSGLVLDPECMMKASTFSKANSEPFQQDLCAPDGRNCYLVPSLLSQEPHFPSLPQYHKLPPLAFRSLGCQRTDIPLSIFYQLVAYLMFLFPSSAKCKKYAARFHIGVHYMLDIIYAEIYIKVVVYICGREQALTASSETSDVCANVRTTISECLKTLSKAISLLELQPAVLIENSTPGYVDFIDLDDFSPLGTNQVFRTVGGLLFSLSRDFFLWYGRFGLEPSAIQKRFVALADNINAERAVGWLYQKRYLKGAEVDQVLAQDVRSRSQFLLRLLEKKGTSGLKAMDAMVYENSLKITKTAVETSLNSNDCATQTGDGNLEPSYQLRWVRAGSTSQSIQSSDAHEQSNTRRPKHQQLNQDSQPSDPIGTTEGSSSQLAYVCQHGSRYDNNEFSSIFPLSTEGYYSGVTLPSKGCSEVHQICEIKYTDVKQAEDPSKDGDFGTVNHGILYSDTAQSLEIAVKRPKNAKQFCAEIHFLSQYSHKNIVRLFGFSSDGPELCLVYEYMQRGCLLHQLNQKGQSGAFDWHTRLTIGKGIASALKYLHTTLKQPVIHRDVKSSNVLLGGNFEAKLCDFKLAIADDDVNDVVPEVESLGTCPYMAPEAFQGLISTKMDVYGLGMILYELATGFPPYSRKWKRNLKQITDSFSTQEVVNMLDPKARWPDRESEGQISVGLSLLNVAKLATTDHSKRPSITKIFYQMNSLIKGFML